MNRERKLLSFLVGAAGLYAIGYVIFGPEYPRITSERFAEVQGCYSAEGRPLLRVQGSTAFSGAEARGFKGVREKSRDVLLMDSPVQLKWSGKKPALVTAGTARKVGISYGPPVRLTFWDERHREVAAVKSPCTNEYSRSAF